MADHPARPPAGVARVTVTDNGKVAFRDALMIPTNELLRRLRLPLRYGGWLSDHELEVTVEFDPPVRPEGFDG